MTAKTTWQQRQMPLPNLKADHNPLRIVLPPRTEHTRRPRRRKLPPSTPAEMAPVRIWRKSYRTNRGPQNPAKMVLQNQFTKKRRPSKQVHPKMIREPLGPVLDGRLVLYTRYDFDPFWLDLGPNLGSTYLSTQLV